MFIFHQWSTHRILGNTVLDYVLDFQEMFFKAGELKLLRPVHPPTPPPHQGRWFNVSVRLACRQL